MPQSYHEFPRRVYWLLFVCLWGLLIATIAVLYLHRDALQLWRVYLYGGLLATYLWAEKRAHQVPSGPGQRRHEWLRYLLSLSWWALVIASSLYYGLWPARGLAVSLAGALLTLAGTGLRVWSVRALGQSFSGHIETFQGQTVVEAGPYRWIRHPGYAGSMLQVVGMPLVLNAYGILVLSAVVIGLFIRRLLWEEEFLSRQLEGYKGYAGKTKRILPGLW
jgi:protein-S-isoprenylcysteine O-methyltransferase Ste14